MKEFFKDIPWQIKAVWIGGLIVTMSLLGFAIWVIIKLLQYWGII